MMIRMTIMKHTHSIRIVQLALYKARHLSRQHVPDIIFIIRSAA
jgi:hypothetical protein